MQNDVEKYLKARDEMVKINEALQQVKQHNERVEAQIEISKRVVKKSEQHMSEVETVKQDQDYAIERLTTKLKEMTESKNLLDNQLGAQRAEAKIANDALAGARDDMSKVEFETKQLEQQWRASLLGVAKRDKALEDIARSAEKAEGEGVDLAASITNTQNKTRQSQERNEILLGRLNNMKNDQEKIKKKIAQMNNQREKVGENYSLLLSSLKKTEEETIKNENILNTLNTSLKEKNIKNQKLSKELNIILEKYMNIMNERSNIDKSMIDARKTAESITEETKKRQMEIDRTDNEIAKINLEALNTAENVNILKENTAKLTIQTKEKQEKIDTCHIEIRKNNASITKRQLFVDHLNKKYDDLRKNKEDENTGPLEARIVKLKNENKSVKDQCEVLQKEWLRKQTELMELQTTIQTLTRLSDSKKNKNLILQQKKTRIECQLKYQESEINDLIKSKKQFRTEMDRLNEMTIKHNIKFHYFL
eukprot:GHVL01005249.1.p1 GENE.GHVL01005249.1~~GHVL01005249.1.p1  ORF type:complete len:552 (-),score=174.84 GHVL01005249.1:37-1476(-)